MEEGQGSLAWRAFVGGARFFVAMAAVLVLAAWSFAYWNGWAFLANFAVCTGVFSWYFVRRDPALVERRMQAGPGAEREPRQKAIQAFTSVMFLALLVVPGLDFRFHWSAVPLGLVVAGHALFDAGFAGIFLVIRVNSFASGIIETMPGQRVIDSGPYALVRHPMYAAALLLFVGAPLALGSYWALLIVVPMTGGLVARLLDEERYLVERLVGYSEYRRRVKARLVPGVW
jgi:protein-S-isoprenylcysteine O-methyltransferase Ste14